MNEEFTARDLARALNHAAKIERAEKLGRIGWIIAVTSLLCALALAIAIRLSEPQKTAQPPLTIDNSSKTPEVKEDSAWGAEPTILEVGLGPWRKYLVSAYAHTCTNPRSGKEPKHPQPMSNGKWPEANWSVAAPPGIPYGTVLQLSYRGILTTRIVGDRGPDIIEEPGKLPRLDLFMSSCQRANDWGKRVVDVREVRRPLGGRR